MPARTPRIRLVLGLLAAACLGALAIATFTRVPEAHGAGMKVYSDLDYDLGSPPANPAHNRLDLYVPRGARRSPRPLVVWVHGGGWRNGDKERRVRRKARLFASAGYAFASVNYRLSPSRFDPRKPDPHRTRFPAHPRDVAEAIGWLDRHGRDFGARTRRMLLAGHSAGAHLVSLLATDPRYLQRHGVHRRQVAGFVSLDSPGHDIAKLADPETPPRTEEELKMFWGAFGAPGEPFARRSWRRGSPLRFADPRDPRALLVTQRRDRLVETNSRFARALGQPEGRAVFPVALDHVEINRALGAASDPEGVSAAVLDFSRRVLRGRSTP